MVKGRHHISGYSALYDFSIDRSISKCGDRSVKSKFLWRSKSICCIASIAMRIHGNYGIKSIQFSIK